MVTLAYSQAIQEIGDDPSEGNRNDDRRGNSPEDCYRTEPRGFKGLFSK